MHSKLIHPKAGIFGSVVILVGLLVPILPYRGLEGEAFSPINHFVSELGEYGISTLAFFFNACLIVGGICFLLFMISLLRDRKHKLLYPVVGFGVIASISTTFIGVFPVNNLNPHINAAAGLFISGLFSITLFSIYALFNKQSLFPKWLALPGFITAIVTAAFLILPRYYPDWVLDPHYQTRPEVWAYTIIEWIAILGIVLWVSLVSVFSVQKAE